MRTPLTSQLQRCVATSSILCLGLYSLLAIAGCGVATDTAALGSQHGAQGTAREWDADYIGLDRPVATNLVAETTSDEDPSYILSRLRLYDGSSLMILAGGMRITRRADGTMYIEVPGRNPPQIGEHIIRKPYKLAEDTDRYFRIREFFEEPDFWNNADGTFYGMRWFYSLDGEKIVWIKNEDDTWTEQRRSRYRLGQQGSPMRGGQRLGPSEFLAAFFGMLDEESLDLMNRHEEAFLAFLKARPGGFVLSEFAEKIFPIEKNNRTKGPAKAFIQLNDGGEFNDIIDQSVAAWNQLLVRHNWQMFAKRTVGGAKDSRGVPSSIVFEPAMIKADDWLHLQFPANASQNFRTLDELGYPTWLSQADIQQAFDKIVYSTYAIRRDMTHHDQRVITRISRVFDNEWRANEVWKNDWIEGTKAIFSRSHLKERFVLEEVPYSQFGVTLGARLRGGYWSRSDTGDLAIEVLRRITEIVEHPNDGRRVAHTLLRAQRIHDEPKWFYEAVKARLEEVFFEDLLALSLEPGDLYFFRVRVGSTLRWYAQLDSNPDLSGFDSSVEIVCDYPERAQIANKNCNAATTEVEEFVLPPDETMQPPDFPLPP